MPIERADFVSVPVQDLERAKRFYSDTGVCHMACFRDTEGNALMLHRRYAPFRDGRMP
jgi:predicted enzyme related to lactoylglutathione lyase